MTKTRELLESSRGVGSVATDDGVVRSFPYLINVYQDMIDGRIPGLKSISGTLSAPGATLLGLVTGRAATLTLEDGRRLSFFVDGSGRLTGTGGFF